MPATSLDARTALIVIDLQKGIVGLPTAHPIEDVVQRSAALAAAFRARGLPVVLVNVAGQPPGRTEQGARLPADLPGDWTDLVADLDRHADDVLITKHTRGAFTNTGLEERLRELDVTQVVITGVATSSGVESTARDAHERGFNVTLVRDAMTDRDRDAHEHSIERVFPRVAETGTTAEVLELLRGED